MKLFKPTFFQGVFFCAPLFLCGVFAGDQNAPRDVPSYVSAFHQGAYQQALAGSQKAHESDPEDVEAFRWYCESLWVTGQYETLENAAAHRFEGRPDDEYARFHFARALYVRGGYGEAEERLKGFDPALPGHHQCRWLLAKIYMETGRRDEARRILSVLPKMIDVLEQETGDSLFYYAKGLVLLGRVTRNPQWYEVGGGEVTELAVKANPSDQRIRAEEAVVYLRQGYHQTAKEILTGYSTEKREHVNGVRDHNPHLPSYRVLHARMKDFGNETERDEAMALLEDALLLNPDFVGARVAAARAALGVGDEDSWLLQAPWLWKTVRIWRPDVSTARGHLEKSLRVNPRHAPSLALLAACAQWEGDEEAFEKKNQAALETDRFCTEAEFVLAQMHLRAGNFEEAALWCRKGIQRDSERGSLHALLGITLLNKGDEAEGKTALRRGWETEKFPLPIKNFLTLFEERIPQDFKTVTFPGHRLRLMHLRPDKDKDERLPEAYVGDALILGDALKKWLLEWHSVLEERYGFVEEELSIEIFRFPNDYQVRATGLDGPVESSWQISGNSLLLFSPFRTAKGSECWSRGLALAYVQFFIWKRTNGTLSPSICRALADWEWEDLRPEWRWNSIRTAQNRIPGPWFFRYVQEKYGEEVWSRIADGLEREEELFGLLDQKRETILQEYRLWLDQKREEKPDLPRLQRQYEALIEEGKEAEALSVLEMFSRNHPVHPAHLVVAAKAALHQKQPEAAVRFCEAAFGWDPYLPEMFFLWGEGLRALDQKKEAADHFRRAWNASAFLWRQPADLQRRDRIRIDAGCALSDTLWRLDRREEAWLAWKAAAEIDVNDSKVRGQISRFRENLEQGKEAQR